MKDQSRQGESKNGKDAGELDLFVCENAMQQDVIIEGLNLFSCDTTKIKNHYEKIWGYDKSGNPLNVFLVYANVEDISQFSEKYKEYFESYKGEFPCESIAFEKYPYANIKVRCELIENRLLTINLGCDEKNNDRTRYNGN